MNNRTENKKKYVILGGGIARRWLFNSMGVIVLSLIVIVIVLSVAMKEYYYGSVHQYIESEANSIESTLRNSAITNTTDLESQIKLIVESFPDKDKIELMALDNSGRTVLSSSGFESTDISDSELIKPHDFVIAHENFQRGLSGKGDYTGVLESGEKVMAVTTILPQATKQYFALRYVVSLEKIDGQINSLIFMFSLIALGIILFLTMTGLYFVRSIIRPITQVSRIARRMASGDFNVRINKQYNDEVGALCDIINDMADELSTTDKMKNEFISSISHELRTPLTAIKGWGETLLMSGSDKETLGKGMRIIISETERLSDMVEELLDFSRMQSGRFSLVLAKMDILAELTDAVLMFTERAKREGLTIEYSEPTALSAVNGDRNRLRQVFVNIIDNALKYSDEGGKVTIIASEYMGQIVISVEDSGCGIAQEELPRVKERFYKGNQSRRGSGIGLAVADEIVSMHGGELKLSSVLDVGTKVTIILPAAPQETPIEETPVMGIQMTDVSQVIEKDGQISD